MYATLTDLISRFGENDLVNLTDVNRSGAINLVTIDRAIADADSEIDSYVAVRYSLPLASVPTELTRVACDIARYRLYGLKPLEEVRQRYEDAIKWLAGVANGSRSLGLPAAQAPVVSNTVQFNSGSSVFTRAERQ